MLANWKTCLLAGALSLGAVGAMPLLNASARDSHASVSEKLDGDVAYATYTVWYRRPGFRWTGVTGLSYYHACQMRDSYWAKGWDAYVERE